MTENNSQLNRDKWQFRFFTIWFGQAFSMLGSHLAGFAFVWHLTETTRSATVLTIGTLMQILPQVLISPIAGTLVDRWNRKMVMIVFDSITALFTFLLAILFYLDSAQIWHIYLLMFVRSTCGQLQWAALTASTTLMVPKKQLSRVAGFNQTLNGGMNILGPALGAFLIALLPMQGVLLIDVSTALLAVIPLLFFHIPQPIRNGEVTLKEPGAKTSLWQELAEGWKYVVGWPSLLSIIIIAMLVNFLVNPAFSLLPLVITDHFGLGAYELGLMNSTFGIGVIVGGLVLTTWGGFKNRILTSLVALTLCGGALLAIGVAPANMFVLALAGIALFGFLNPLVNGPLMAVMQSQVEPELQGRVLSLLNAGAGLASPLGLLIAGPLADATHNQFWFILGGIAVTLIGLATFFFPKVLALGIDAENKLPEHAEASLEIESAHQ